MLRRLLFRLVRRAHRGGENQQDARPFGAVIPAFTSFLLIASASAAPLEGLDTRPANPTCLAGDSPSAAPIYSNVFTQIWSYKPFDLRQSPGDPSRWYFITRDGRLYTFVAPDGVPQLVLDIRDRIGVLNSSNAYSTGGSEQWGLVGFALHPNFATDGRVFLLFTGRQANETASTSYVVSYTSSGDGTSFDRQTAKTILSLTQATDSVNHHFGNVVFGPAGLLFIGSGDGGHGGMAQNCNDLRGKILRLDINTTDAYKIPSANPFASNSACRGEVYAMGLRNPWRFSFDSQTNALWVADVGAGSAEEVDQVVSGGNYGWPIYEGFECKLTAQCGSPGLQPPLYAYPHGNQGLAIIGGYVYHGSAIPSLQGSYVFSLWGEQELLALRQSPTTGGWNAQTLATGTANYSSHFVDRDGEMYSITGYQPNPVVRKLVPDPSQSPDTNIPAVLSATGCVDAANPRNVVSGAIPYSVNSPLWSDGATKRRWAALPDGSKITITSDGDFKFPINSVLIKEFSLGGKPVETRLLKYHTNGTWAGYTYAWRSDLSDADLVTADGMDGPTIPGTTTKWWYPSRAQCMVCHTEAANYALGPEIAQLNRISPNPYPQSGRQGNELATWAGIGLFSTSLSAPVAQLPALVDPSDTTAALALRARSYLHANCAGCHRSGGPTRAAIDLRYWVPPSQMNACNTPPVVSDLGVTGAMPIVPQQTFKSLIYLRMTRRDANQMPPLGTRLVDRNIGEIVTRYWINSANVCTDVADSDGDGIPDDSDNCITKYNPDQEDTNHNRIGNRCDADFTDDGLVNNDDRQKLILHLGAKFGDPSGARGWGPRYDLDGDGYIGQSDLDIFNAELAGHPPGPSALSN